MCLLESVLFGVGERRIHSTISCRVSCRGRALMCYNVMHVYRTCIKRRPKTECKSSKALICVAKLVKKCLAVALLLMPNLKD